MTTCPNICTYLLFCYIKIISPCWVEVPLYVLEDRLVYRVANWEDQTKEDLVSKFCKRREKIAYFSHERTEDNIH